MRIVADTNTVLSGLLWQGSPRRLLELARERKVSLCTSLMLLAELAEVIAREKFAERVRAAGLSAAELVQDYERLAEVITPEPLPAPESVRVLLQPLLRLWRPWALFAWKESRKTPTYVVSHQSNFNGNGAVAGRSPNAIVRACAMSQRFAPCVVQQR